MKTISGPAWKSGSKDKVRMYDVKFQKAQLAERLIDLDCVLNLALVTIWNNLASVVAGHLSGVIPTSYSHG